MESTAQINRHPIHPMLIPYPFALLTTAAALDVAARITRRYEYARTASQLTTLGIGSGLAAAVPGIVDYFGTVPPSTPTRRLATQHALSNVSALACFAVAQARRRRGAGLPDAGQLLLELAGTGLLSLGGWLGGHLVYEHHVGVVDDVDAAEKTLAATALPAGRRRQPSRAPSVPEPVL